jgi:hypothetical protein
MRTNFGKLLMGVCLLGGAGTAHAYYGLPGRGELHADQGVGV